MAIKVTMNLVVFSLVVVAVALVQSSATLHEVAAGGTTGWIIPSGGSSAYTTWAASQTFAVGDILLFTFTTGAHDVVEVPSKTEYDGCSSANAVSTATTGPANITLSTAGEHFFICTFGTHCTQGQKLAINVTANATSAPSPTGTTTASPPPPPGTTTASPPPPPSAAQPLAVAAALPITLVSIALALLH